MKVKKFEEFYKNNDLKVSFDEDGMPIINGVDCMCDVAKCPNKYSCHSGTPCELFKPNERFGIWQEQGEKAATEVDWDKEYIVERPKSELELKIEELESRLAALEDK